MSVNEKIKHLGKGKSHIFLTSKAQQNEQPCEKQGNKQTQLPGQVNRAFVCRCSDHPQGSGHGETPTMN